MKKKTDDNNEPDNQGPKHDQEVLEEVQGNNPETRRESVNDDNGPKNEGANQGKDLEEVSDNEPVVPEEQPEETGKSAEEASEVPNGEPKPLDMSSLMVVKEIGSRSDLGLLEDRESLIELFHFTENALKDKSKGALQKLEEGKQALHRFMIQHDRAEFAVQASFTNFAIKIGMALNVLKALCKQTGHKWESWAHKNITFIRKRARQEYMLLGSRIDSHKYAVWMDKQKLVVLVNATKDMQGDDPIGAFMKKHKITLTEQAQITYEQFKVLVDTALAMERIEKREIKGVDRAKVQALIELDVRIEGGLLHDLELTQDTGGDVNTYLANLHRNKGKKDTSLDPLKKMEAYNSLTDKWKGYTQLILDDPEVLNKLEHSDIRTMHEVLIKLAKALKIEIK
jgi:hypothetical protein